MQFKPAGDFILNKLRNELPANLSYHTLDHIQDVYQAAKRIGRQEKVTDYELELLLTAAWYHDSGFIHGSKDHEEASCKIARETLPGFDYTPAEIERICRMIMAT